MNIGGTCHKEPWAQQQPTQHKIQLINESVLYWFPNTDWIGGVSNYNQSVGPTHEQLGIVLSMV